MLQCIRLFGFVVSGFGSARRVPQSVWPQGLSKNLCDCGWKVTCALWAPPRPDIPHSTPRSACIPRPTPPPHSAPLTHPHPLHPSHPLDLYLSLYSHTPALHIPLCPYVILHSSHPTSPCASQCNSHNMIYTTTHTGAGHCSLCL